MAFDKTTFGTDTVVGVLGDTHGNTCWTLDALDKLRDAGMSQILQLGDFGVWPNHESFLRKVNARIEKNDQILAVTLGNHENYTRMESAVASPDYPGWRILQGYNSILFAPRVHKFTWAGIDFLSVGGGNSIDRCTRIPDVTWWAAEQITQGDVYRASEVGNVPIMVTHDCPDGVPLFGGHKAGPSAELMFGRAGAEYAIESRKALRAIVDVVQPELLLHGHYHFFADHTVDMSTAEEEQYTVRTVGLSRDEHRKSIGLLSIPTREVTLIN